MLESDYPPLQHFNRLRPERALHRLGSTRQSLKEIASEVGQEDAQSVARLLRRVFGRSVSALRNAGSQR